MVLAELKVQQGFADDFKQQQQIGKLSKARYLVVGSVQRLVGVTIRARLVDTQTGLVAQTAKIVAINMEEALNQVPDLAKQLMMNDAAKAAFEQEMQAKAVQPVEKAPDKAAVPPAPLAPPQNAADAPPPPPPPPPMVNPAPPVFVQAKEAVFQNLAPQPEVFVAPQINPLQNLLQNRLLFATIERGDFLFRTGRFRQALRQYEFALTLAPDNFDIRLRIERCAPFVPPPVYFVAKPRIAIMPFMTLANTPFGPPAYLSYWTPNHLAPYFAYRYEVVDPSEVYWYMGRMGLTMNDILVDPNARRWLARAVGVRYFLFGNHIETASFNVNTYLVDAEFGYLQSSARIHVRDPFELKLRLGELAELTMLTPAEQAGYQQARFYKLIAEGRRHMAERKYGFAVREFDLALQIHPWNVEVRVLLEQARQRARFEEFEENRRRQFAAQQATLAAQRQRQWELAQAAERARRQALAEAAARNEAQRQTHLSFRFGAQANLVSRAEIALQTKNFGLSVSFFKSAAAFTPPPNVVTPVKIVPVNYQSFAQARLEAEKAEQLRIAQFTATREATLRQEREKQLAAVQKQLANERTAAQAKLEAQKKAQLEHDDIAFKAAIKQGKNYMTQDKNEAALAAFQGAQRVAHTQKQQEEVNTLIDIIVQRQAEALAKTKEDKAEIDRKLAQERLRRKAAESEAKNNEEKYQLALTAAKAALANKDYPVAKKRYEEAGQIFKTDAVLVGLRQIESDQAAAITATQKAELDKKKSAVIKQYLSDGKAALDAKKYPDALRSYREAKKLAPNDIDVIAGLTQAEQAYARVSAEDKRKTEEAGRTENFQRLLRSGQANLASKQFEAAVANLQEAVKLNPTDATAINALKNAEKARDGAFADATAKAAAKKRADAYQKYINEGRLALDNKRFTDAISAFGEAQKLMPGDKASKEYQADAIAAKKASEDAVVAAAKKRAAEMKRAADLQTALTQGRALLAAKDFKGAEKALGAAQKLAPENIDVKNALRDLAQAEKQAATEAAAQKQRKQQFDSLLASGQAAMKAGNYQQALNALSSATTLMPENKEAQDLFRRAQNEAREADEKAAKSKLQELITTGLANIKAKNYDAAEKALRSAAQVDPNNATIIQGLKDIDAGRRALAESKQLQANYDLAISQGQKAFQSKDYKGAIASAQQALKLIANDPAASKLLQQAQAAQASADKAAASYNAAMTAGNKAMNAKDYKDAIKHYTEASNLFPQDQAARQALARAREASQPPPPPKIDFDAAMKRGAAAEAKLNFSEANNAYDEAVKARPKDQSAINKANFTQAIVNAEQAINNAMWKEAQREVDNALRLFPKNAHAQKLQQRVKNKK